MCLIIDKDQKPKRAMKSSDLVEGALYESNDELLRFVKKVVREYDNAYLFSHKSGPRIYLEGVGEYEGLISFTLEEIYLKRVIEINDKSLLALQE